MKGVKGGGRALFVAILLLIVGVLNIIYGFGAIGNATFFTDNRPTCSPASMHGGGSR